VEFRILGPLEVVEDNEPVALGTLKERLVLGVLLLHANEFSRASGSSTTCGGKHRRRPRAKRSTSISRRSGRRAAAPAPIRSRPVREAIG
jgi:hypothetical protein